MRLLVDTTPLRVSRDFRRLWVGQAVSFVGSMITVAALPYQVFHQTGSSLAVGLLGLAQLGPLLVFSLVGGAFADSVDKRRLLLGVTAVSAGCSALLAVNASLDRPQLWLLYVLGAVASAAFAVSFPVLRSLLQAKAKTSCPALILDMTEVQFVDSTGLAAIIEYLRDAATFAGMLCIAGLQQPVETTFEIVKLDKVLSMFRSLEEAKEAIRGHSLPCEGTPLFEPQR